MSINDRLKKVVDDLDLDRRVGGAEEKVQEGVATAGDYAYDHREDIERSLGNAARKVVERTDGKYADQVARVHRQLSAGLGKLASKSRKAQTPKGELSGPDEPPGGAE